MENVVLWLEMPSDDLWVRMLRRKFVVKRDLSKQSEKDVYTQLVILVLNDFHCHGMLVLIFIIGFRSFSCPLNYFIIFSKNSIISIILLHTLAILDIRLQKNA